MSKPELSKQRQPDVLPRFEPPNPSLGMYFLLTAIAGTMLAASFVMRPDWPGLLENVATSILTAVLLLILVDRRLRESDVHRLKHFPHALRAHASLMLSSEHRQLVQYAKAYLAALRPYVTAKVETQQLKYIEAAADKSFVLLGATGSGKTTLLQMLAAQRARGFVAGHDKLPVIYPLVTWQSARPLEAAILEHVNGFAPVRWRSLNRLLKTGQLVLILDGIDDLSRHDAALFLDALPQFTASYPRVTVIVSARPKDDTLTGDLPTVSIVPLTPEELRSATDARRDPGAAEAVKASWL